LIEYNFFLTRLRLAVGPTVRIVYIKGNHDKRPDDYIKERASAIYGIRPVDELHLPASMSMERLLNFDMLGIETVEQYPDGEFWFNPKIQGVHGTRATSGSGKTTLALVNASQNSFIQGHIHKQEMAATTKYRPDGTPYVVVAISPGCLCGVHGELPASKKRNNWQQGCALIDFAKWSQAPSATFLPFVDGETIYNGGVLRGQDYLPELKEAYPEWRGF
jgi:hypothetical protein